MQYSTRQTRRRLPSLTPYESKKLPCVGVVFAETYRPPQILLRICLLFFFLFVVLHNSFIISLVFVMCFSVFHLHILMNFVLCFAGVVEAGFICCSVEISRFPKFRNLRNFLCVHYSYSSLFVFCNLSFPVQYINFSIFFSPSFNIHL